MTDAISLSGYTLAPPAGSRFPTVATFVSPVNVQLVFQLVPKPTAGPTPPIPTPIAVASPNIVSLPFLGSGIIRPFVRDQKNDIANDSGTNLVRSCVGQVAGTRCANDAGTVQGELRWRPAFGAQLYLLKHAKGAARAELARIYILDALVKWEPRVTNVRMTVTFDDPNLMMKVDIVYDVIRTNVPGNQVLVQGVTQSLNFSTAA